MWVKALSSILSYLLMGTSLVTAAPICYDTGNFTTSITYGNNRDLVLASLPPNVSAKGGFFTASVGQNSDKVYALAIASCPNQKEAFSWGDDGPCIARYANCPFLGILELEPTDAGYNMANLTLNLTEFDTCTPDLSHDDCDTCLWQTANYYDRCCHGYQGGYVQSPNCWFRWELYPFYASNAATTDLPSYPPSTPGSSPPIITEVGTAPHENSTEKFDLDNVGTSQEFPSMQLDILQAATNGFSDENKLGQGGFGHVYKFRSPFAGDYKWEKEQQISDFGTRSKGEGMKLIEEHLVESSVPAEVLKCIQIGLLCVQTDPADRPTMSTVVAMLGNDTITLPLPAEPAFYVRRFVAEPIRHNSSDRICSINEVTISNMSPR
ncbi:cysteine-rich RLK (RECEPTOR-like protein kinase) 30 [Hibiscus trionum]|uniref:Cysteine-rich RLK (RECEPTOR-like protein kinase) 30 n=1 Tax=Hibiscus trionum TaxID=183268 RepID=A0A9W7H900_HIBTR|nr:cysteine-rich RLK (RECEPTOR-like protein kinase) 30 [Hibiscus trionum]